MPQPILFTTRHDDALKSGTLKVSLDMRLRRSMRAVLEKYSQHGGFGCWDWSVARQPGEISDVIESKAGQSPAD